MGARFRRHDTLCCVGGLLDNCKQNRVLSVASTKYGWWYSAPTPDARTLVCCVSDADIIRRLGATEPHAWLALLRPVTRELSLGDLPRRVTLAAYSCESAILQEIGRAWIAVGDASARFDPLAATGVVHAIRSGHAAGEAIASYLQGNSGTLIDFMRGEINTFGAYRLLFPVGSARVCLQTCTV
jgi:flavin-dependent dehydrogenase